MRGGGGVICDPSVLDRLGYTDEDDELEGTLPLPARVSQPEMWPLPPAEGDEHREMDFDTFMRATRRRQSGTVVSLTKLRG
jgi:hypothetical protein